MIVQFLEYYYIIHLNIIQLQIYNKSRETTTIQYSIIHYFKQNPSVETLVEQNY